MGHGHYIDPFAQGEAPIRIGAGEKRIFDFVVLPGESRDIALTLDLVGEGAEVLVRAAYLCNSDEHVRMRILVHHRARACRSRQLLKGVVAGKADVRFDGRIVVAPDAQQTEAYQENHNILLSETAWVDTKPQLEIYADDVKCSHGATVGQLSAEEAFYMRSRGIPEQEARRLQILSFLSPVMEGLSGAEQERLQEAVSTLVL